MEKIKSLLKKNLKTSIMIFTIMICNFVFSNKVNAEELTNFCDYTSPCLTTEHIDNWIVENNIDTTIYDSYLITVAPYSSTSNNFSILFFNYQEHLDNLIYTEFYSGSVFLRFKSNVYYFKKSTNVGKKFLLSTPSLSTSNSGSIQLKGTNSDIGINNGYIAYYSNKNILDADGNVVLYRNDIELPKEDPNVVNNRTFLVKLTNFYKSLFSIISDIASTIIITPVLVIPFGFCILAIIVGVFYKLFLRR